IQMIIFTVMSLILTIGGVTALLRRNIFLPVQKLRNYVESSAKIDDVPEPPPHLPHDLDIIAARYYDVKMRVTGKRKNSEEPSNDFNKGN
ncbi:MAG: hypothetical protein WC007_17860, partial [Pelobacteraceae bacterium]